MALTVKKITLWRKETENTPGAAAGTLECLAPAAGSLGVFMGYRIPGNESKAILEIAPVTGKKAVKAAGAAGLAASTLPALLVEGDDRAGLGLAFTSTLAANGINLAFLVALVVGRRFSAVFGLESDDDAKKAVPLIKKAAAKPKSKPRPKKR